MTGVDRDDLSRALDAAIAATKFAGLPSADEDKDLVLLGRALREGVLTEMVGGLAHKALRLRHQVVERNLPLAYSLARRIAARYDWVRQDDARQVASLALMQAVARYRPARAASDQGWLSTHVFRLLERWATKERRRAITVLPVGDDIFRDVDNDEVDMGDIEQAIDVTRVATTPGLKSATRRLARRFTHGTGPWTSECKRDLERITRALGGPEEGGQKYKVKDSSRATRARSRGSQSGQENG